MDETHPKGLSSRAAAALARYTSIADLFDQAFRVPGTRWRFGLDALLGFIPGLGDAAGALLGAYGLLVARQLGAPTSVQARMLGNLALDALAGAVPIAGDLFDFAFKAHVRNRLLLERWLERPQPVRRRSRATLLLVLLALLAILGGTLWLAIAVLRALFGWIGGALV